MLSRLSSTKVRPEHLDRDALAKLCDPANYLGQAGVMVDRVLDRLPRSTSGQDRP